MKIAILISSLGPGGAERTASMLAGGWSLAGHQVTLLTFEPAGTAPFYRLPGDVRFLPLDLSCISRGLTGKLRANSRRLKVIRRKLLELKPDLLVSFVDQTNILAVLAARRTGIPVIATEHADPSAYSPGRPWAILRRLLYRQAAAVVCASAGIAKELKPRIRRNAIVIPNPVAAGEVAVAGAAAPKRSAVVAMGRLSGEKGFDLLIRAFARITDRHPGCILEIWGEGHERGALEALVSELGIVNRVRLPGLTHEPADVLQSAELFVLSSRHEGFGNVIVEAMAQGLPVISFDCPSGPREIISHGHDGLLVPAGDVGALAEAIDRLLSRPEQRRRLGNAALQSAQRFSLDRILDLWQNLFNEIACPLCGALSPRYRYTAGHFLKPDDDCLWDIVRCPDCRLVYPLPRPGNNTETALPFYFSDGRQISRMLARISGFPAGRLLDIGCGNGDFLHAAAGRGWTVTGMEREGTPNPHGLTVCRTPSEIAALPENSYDLVTLWGVTEYLDEPAAFFGQAVRLLKPGGHLLLTASNYDSLQRKVMKTHSFPRQRLIWSLSSLKFALEQAGLAVQRCDSRNDIRNGWCTELVTFAFKRYILRIPLRRIIAEHSKPGKTPLYLVPVKLFDRLVTVPLSLLLQAAGHNGVITITAVKQSS